jgi:hypothetical protein
MHVRSREWSGGAQANEVVHEFDLPIPAYDILGTMLPVLVMAQPLRLGYSGIIPVIGDSGHPVRGFPFRVVGRERVRAGARGMVDAWVVECPVPPPVTGTLRLWISERIPYPVKMDVPSFPGQPRAVYEMIG